MLLSQCVNNDAVSISFFRAKKPSQVLSNGLEVIKEIKRGRVRMRGRTTDKTQVITGKLDGGGGGGKKYREHKNKHLSTTIDSVDLDQAKNVGVKSKVVS